MVVWVDLQMYQYRTGAQVDILVYVQPVHRVMSSLQVMRNDLVQQVAVMDCMKCTC